MRCKVDGMLLACSAERRKAQEEREGRVPCAFGCAPAPRLERGRFGVD